MTEEPSGPTHVPILKGIPTAEPQVSFCVEKPLMRPCAKRVGSEAGKPKQSGSIYSSLCVPNSCWKKRLPYRKWRTNDSEEGMFASFSSTEEPAGNQRPAATSFFNRS